MRDTTAYKVLTADQMATLEHDGSFAGAPIDLHDGYIHLSTADQLGETIEKHFAGQTGLWLAAVDLEARWKPRWRAPMRWPASRRRE